MPAEGSSLQVSARSRSAILSFFLLAFFWAWGLGFLAVQVKASSPNLSSILLMAAGFAPSLSGLAVVAVFSSGAGLKHWLAHCLNWRLPWFWLLGAFLAPPALMFSAQALHAALGGEVPPWPTAGELPMVIANFALVLLVGGPLGEELGWRGYAMSALTTRVRWRAASLILGVVWGLWHVPLFFLAGSAQSHMSMLVFLVNILAGSVVFGWLFEQTGGRVLPAVVLHTSLNTWAGILGIVPTASSGRPYALVTGLLASIALLLLIQADRTRPAFVVDAGSVGQVQPPFSVTCLRSFCAGLRK